MKDHEKIVKELIETQAGYIAANKSAAIKRKLSANLSTQHKEFLDEFRQVDNRYDELIKIRSELGLETRHTKDNKINIHLGWDREREIEKNTRIKVQEVIEFNTKKEREELEKAVINFTNKVKKVLKQKEKEVIK